MLKFHDDLFIIILRAMLFLQIMDSNLSCGGNKLLKYSNDLNKQFCGKFTQLDTTVKCWYAGFKCGRRVTDDVERNGYHQIMLYLVYYLK